MYAAGYKDPFGDGETHQFATGDAAATWLARYMAEVAAAVDDLPTFPGHADALALRGAVDALAHVVGVQAFSVTISGCVYWLSVAES